MYPYDIIPNTGINLYVICLGLAAVAAILAFSKLADVVGISAKVQNMSLYTAILAIVFGYGSAVLFQSFYNMLADGTFTIDKNTGATFYGGLIGGVVSFIVIYFIWGNFKFDDDTHKREFIHVLNVAPASITIAHGIGRIGCLMGGCCYGPKTDAWCGITMKNLGYKVIPTQLFEAIFLFLLFSLTVYLIYKKKPYNMPLYMIGYGIWRFILEYVRADDRGQTVIASLTPSQLVAIIMIVSGAVLFAFLKKLNKNADLSVDTDEGEEEAEKESEDV
ncbi:MAG: prolipoprotein diacylglyceryl transferase [Clostridia bacterium]|nr:prolipoprotein diacylglyceryl transferase [Clostridia bacterium]